MHRAECRREVGIGPPFGPSVGERVRSQVPALAEPIVLMFDHEPLDDDDLVNIRAALDESHLVTVHSPTWSLTIRCGVLVRTGFDAGAEGHAAAIAAVESSSVWSSLGGMGIVIAGVAPSSPDHLRLNIEEQSVAFSFADHLQRAVT